MGDFLWANPSVAIAAQSRSQGLRGPTRVTVDGRPLVGGSERRNSGPRAQSRGQGLRGRAWYPFRPPGSAPQPTQSPRGQGLRGRVCGPIFASASGTNQSGKGGPGGHQVSRPGPAGPGRPRVRDGGRPDSPAGPARAAVEGETAGGRRPAAGFASRTHRPSSGSPEGMRPPFTEESARKDGGKERRTNYSVRR